MPYITNWLKTLLFIFFLLIIVTITFAYLLIRQSIPEYNKHYSLSEPFGTIEIIRDTNAIPHIFADDNRDVFFALGFTHAQDRLWQMFLSRRLAHGNLSEVFGKETLEIDDFMRRTDIRRLSTNSLQYQSQRTQEALISYAKGVNSWLGLINQGNLGRGAPEFFLYDSKIKEWDPVDSLSILKLHALQGTSQLYDEVIKLKTILKLRDNKALDLFSQTIEPFHMVTSEFLKKYSNIKFQNDLNKNEKIQSKLMLTRRAIQNSNMASINSKLTTNDGALLAHDFQTILTTPSELMLARMEFQNGGVIGATIPGVPTIIFGRNENIAWGLGNTNADQIDLYIEKLNQENNDEYQTQNGYDTFKRRNSKINIKNEESVSIDLLWSRNGPIIPNRHFGLSFINNSQNLISMKTNALLERDLSMTASIDLMLSNSVNEALQVSKNHVSPVKNLMVIDRKNIAFKLIGKVPKRKPDHLTKGRFPSFGWNDANLWDGYYKYEKNPKILNPTENLLLDTGNNKSENKFPEHITYDWPDTQKIHRLRTKISYRDIYTVESLKEMQSDTISSTARSLLGLVAKDLWYEGELGPSGSTKLTRQQIIKKLSKWNGDINNEMIEPIVFTTWMNLLQKRIIQDDLGQLHVEFQHFRPLFLERVFKNINNANQWCDVRQTTQLESCNQLARETLNDTLGLLSKTHANNISGLAQKNLYQAIHSHEPLGGNKTLKWLFNLTHMIPGAEYTLKGGKNTDFHTEEPKITHGSVYKGIYDLADPDSSLYIISTGQSGHFLSKYYDDLSKKWKDGKYISMSLDPIAAKAGAIGITTIN